MINLDDSTLIAYVDGELDAQTAREVEAKLADNPEAQAFVDRLREIAALSHVAFNDTLHEPVPQHLRTAVMDALQAATPAPQAPSSGANDGANVVTFKPQARTSWTKAVPLAAAFAGLLLGMGGGFQYSEVSSQKSMQLASMSLMQDQAAMDTALNKALEVNLSGNELAWRNPDSGRSAVFTPVRTYQDKSGKYCREYRKDVNQGGATETTYGLACRTDEGQWKTRYLILEDAQGGSL